MRKMDGVEEPAAVESPELESRDLFRPLVDSKPIQPRKPFESGVVVGELVGVINSGTVPLITYPGQSTTAAFPARTTVALHGGHIGRQVVLMFEAGNLERPIIVGMLHDTIGRQADNATDHVSLVVDGECMMVSAKEQLIVRCGKASITLTKSGKVIIQGSYVVTHSSGVNRIKGGSVQIN
jgi:hypothetical protein